MERVFKIEYKLSFFVIYLVTLTVIIVNNGIRAAALTHLVFVVVFSVFYFGVQFIYIFIAPLMFVFNLINNFLIKRSLSNIKLNTPSEVVVILGYPDKKKLEGWITPNVIKSENDILIKYLKKRGQDFSFYPQATMNDVQNIMSDNSIKEVYFFGHGTSHIFQLTNNIYIYYCDFNDIKYGKDFVHQIHCGTKDGKSLVDYVVSKENQDKCFLIRKPINSFIIKKELNKKIKYLSN